MIDYYTRIAPALLPHLRDRPLTLKRYPERRRGPVLLREAAARRTRPSGCAARSGSTEIDYCVCDDLPTLVWLANLADLELHPSLSLVDDIDAPDGDGLRPRPGPPAPAWPSAARWRCCCATRSRSSASRATPRRRARRASRSTCRSTRRRRLRPRHQAALARRSRRHLEAQHPKLIVSQQKKELRKGKVLIDWSQNDEHKTTVCVYSLRARERPTVSTPVRVGRARRARRRSCSRPPTCSSGSSAHGDLFAPVVELRAGAARAVRIREVVLPASDPAAAAGVPPRALRRRRGCASSPGPAVCSHFAVNVPPERFEEAVAWARERVDAARRTTCRSRRWRARAAYFFDPAGQPRRADRARARARATSCCSR